jgi:hypothetical protein
LTDGLQALKAVGFNIRLTLFSELEVVKWKSKERKSHVQSTPRKQQIMPWQSMPESAENPRGMPQAMPKFSDQPGRNPPTKEAKHAGMCYVLSNKVAERKKKRDSNNNTNYNNYSM